MHLDAPEPTRPHRKPRDRELSTRDPQREPASTDLVERLIALQRKNATATRPRERIPSPILNRVPERSPNHTPATTAIRVLPTSSRRQHQGIIARPEADPDDFSRRLKISTSPSPRTSPKNATKLFNPDTDPIPMRHTLEPESISDTANNPYMSRNSSCSAARDVPIRQLFDHRKDDPVRFAVLARPQGRPTPTPQSSTDYISASSTSSYANSVTSSITLSSNTDDSSASSALFEHQGRPTEESGNNTFAVQLKRLYRTISALEDKVKLQDADEAVEESRILLKGKQIENDSLEKEKWKKQIENHKKLAESIHNLLEISLSPSVPASLRNIPTKYNIIIRLWTFAFHKLLESLRRASFTSPLALEHLQDFIYYAYTFYTGLLEEHTLNAFKSGWLEALGDLARYRMAVAAMVTGNVNNGPALTADAVHQASAASLAFDGSSNAAPSGAPSESNSDGPAAQINGSPSPSVGLVAARLLDVEPEKERWRGIARDWYGAGLADTPGTGKLHHHLGLLSREVEGEELRGIYHFIKSMTTLHPFATSRESVLPLWSASAQARRMLPDARAAELFVLLHGMLFTNIQLDDFQPSLARFIERLQIEDVEEREWIMMAVINVSAVLEYGKPGGILRKRNVTSGRDTTLAPGMRVVTKRNAVEEEKMDIDDHRGEHNSKHISLVTAIQTSPTLDPTEPATVVSTPFKLALQLTFAMLTYTLRHPTRKASPFARSTLNPYLTVVLTFIVTVLRQAATLEVLERNIPWEVLARFFASIPRSVISSQLRQDPSQPPASGEPWPMLTSGCAPPLPEDWCLRGMEWVGRRVYERGFWKGAEESRAELEVIDKCEEVEMNDGIIEDGHGDDDGPNKNKVMCENMRRWVRIFRSAVGIASVVEGFTWTEDTKEWKVEGILEEKVKRWQEEEKTKREQEEQRRMGRRWSDDSMDVDCGDSSADDVSNSEDDEDDSDQVKALKARRRYLRNLLQSAGHDKIATSPVSRRSRPRKPRKDAFMPSTLSIVPGYTVLVVDTNILLSSLSMFASVVESLRWTVIVPLPVIMELDGLSVNASLLGQTAQAALAYITSHIRSHATSLKVQTSKGNYLTTLSIRTEQVDFDDGTSHERNMDDLILKAAIWQDEHWVDRSFLLKDVVIPKDTSRAIKVVLLSLDRNLRLKAKSRQLFAASERDLASILTAGS